MAPATEAKSISWDELESHKTDDSCWICIDNKAYDVTEWIKTHPGGKLAILNVAGRDCSDLVKQFHVLSSYSGRIKKMYVGEMAPKDPAKLKNVKGKPAFAEECRQLTQTMEKGGWYTPDSSYFIRKTCHILAIFVLAWVLVLKGYQDEKLWMQYLGGFMVGVFWQQGNFLGHDAGHGSVLLNKYWCDWYGLLVGNISSGLSIAWWKHTHYTHHVVTNVLTHDPDIQHLPVFAVDTRFFQGFFSSYWNHAVQFDKVAQFLVGFQHILFYPIMTISRVLLQVQSIGHILTNVHCPNRMREFGGIVVFYTWWVYMISFLPTWSSMLVFVYMACLGVSLIHVQICMSHFCMEVFDSVPYQQEDESFFEFQLRTSLDIECPEWMDWLHGGLQFQVVHHLFPRVPRHRLRELSVIVQKMCDKHGITYHHCGFYEANRMTMVHMANVAYEARHGKVVQFNDTVMFHGMNLVG
jgi:delta8-fatty-acid desaturase